MSTDYETILNKWIQQITTNIANKNINGAIKDSEILQTNLSALQKSGISNTEIILRKMKETGLNSSEHINCMVDDPACYVFTNTLKQTDGEKYLLRFYNHIENDRNFKRAIELFQSNSIQNKCLELMESCANVSNETLINLLMRRVIQISNGNQFDMFVNKLCAFEYPISINRMMEIFLIEPHQPEFIVSELIREAVITSMTTILQRDMAPSDSDSISKYLLDENASPELLKKCCANYRGFYDLIKTAITKHSKLIEYSLTDDGDSFWYFTHECLGQMNFSNFVNFICILASPPELTFTFEFLVFLKNIFPSELLNHIFARCQ